MSYETGTVYSIVKAINSGHIYLPAIQRKYVWKEEQITKLMDSILCGYPIGTFLFWKVSGETVNEEGYSLYRFIQDYHERDAFTSPRAPSPLPPDDSLFAVLDGQQRLTSLYIALQGTLSMKLPAKRWADDKSFPKKELYLNLKDRELEVDDEITYEFAFRTNDGAGAKNNSTAKKQRGSGEANVLWYRAKDILQYKTWEDIENKVLEPNCWTDDAGIVEKLRTLYHYLVEEPVINYFEVERESLDEVLDIFVRVNSGGTVLSKSDLLFSTVVSHWDKARDEFDELLKSINKIGEKFRFNSDFIIRTCLYVLNLSIDMKVEAFTPENVQTIKTNWDAIKTAIIDTVELLNKFGFNYENMVSYVAVTPMIYHRFKCGPFRDAEREELRKYIIISQVKQIFGASSNSALTKIRDELVQHSGPFNMSVLRGIQFTGDRNLRFNEEEIKGLFELGIGPYTFMLLSLLYPHLKFSQKGFHQDHMHPYSGFSHEALDVLGLDTDKRREWQRRRNCLANLQLLEGRENIRKKAVPLTTWLDRGDNRENAKYLPGDVSYELKDFDEFMEKRQALMEEELKRILL